MSVVYLTYFTTESSYSFLKNAFQTLLFLHEMHFKICSFEDSLDSCNIKIKLVTLAEVGTGLGAPPIKDDMNHLFLLSTL